MKKERNGKKVALRAAAVMLLVALAVLAVTGYVYLVVRQGRTALSGSADGSSAVLTRGTEQGVTLTASAVRAADYETYGVSSDAKGAYTVTADVTPADAADTELCWSLSFADPDSEWAEGKDPETYIYLSVAEDTHSALVSCMDAFGEQVTVTAAAAANSRVYGTCTMDYVASVTDAEISLASVAFSEEGSEYEVSLSAYGYGTGTLCPDSVTVTALSLSCALSVETEAVNSEGETVSCSLASLAASGDTLAVTTPFAAFAEGSEDSVLAAAFNNSFIDAASGEETDGTLAVSCSWSYGGTVYGSAVLETGIAFDVSGLSKTTVSVDLGSDSLVFGEDTSVTISFTIFTVYTYGALEGMTWEEWLSSAYNTDGYYWSEEYEAVCLDMAALLIEKVTADGEPVALDDVIEDGGAYGWLGLTLTVT